jgi:hypothetical protein
MRVLGNDYAGVSKRGLRRNKCMFNGMDCMLLNFKSIGGSEDLSFLRLSMLDICLGRLKVSPMCILDPVLRSMQLDGLDSVCVCSTAPPRTLTPDDGPCADLEINTVPMATTRNSTRGPLLNSLSSSNESFC